MIAAIAAVALAAAPDSGATGPAADAGVAAIAAAKATVSLDAGAAADAGTSPPPRALLLIATAPDAIEKWVAAKPADRAAVKGIVDRVKINERHVMAIALDGYQLPRSRKVELTADIVIIDSTGRTVLEKASACGARTFDPKTQTAVLLRPVGSLLYGVTDPEGVYTARVTVWDQIRGESAKTVVQFTVSR